MGKVLLYFVLILATLIGSTGEHREESQSYLDEAKTEIKVSSGSSSVNTSYTLIDNSEKIVLSVELFNCGQKKQDQIELTQTEYEEIQSVLNQYKVSSWDGVGQFSDRVGSTIFHLEISEDGSSTVKVAGDEKLPEKSGAFKEDFFACVENLFAKREKYPDVYGIKEE